MIMIFSIDLVHSFPPPLKLGGIWFLKFGQRGGSCKNWSEIGSQLKGSQKGGFAIHQFSLRKTCFHYYWNFCLVNIHTCCNQQIYSFMWFSFYQKIIYYEISFPPTLIFKCNFVKILFVNDVYFPFHFIKNFKYS